MDAQLKKGMLPYCVLLLIRKDNLYGYDIVKIIQKYFANTEESTIYAILRRLCNEGYTDSYIGTESFGPQRKYYKINKKGDELLNSYEQSWQEIVAIIASINNVDDKTGG